MNLESEYKAIFELNNKSSLFARVAYDAMNNGDYEEAILILQRGIELFENYPTAYFLLGKALQKVYRDEEADEFFKKGNSLLTGSSAFDYYSNSLHEVGKEEMPTSDTDELQELADVLQTAKIEVNYEETNPPFENENEEFKPLKGLVSETLATIYFDQANYKEAKAIYDTLIEIQPEREHYYRTKIFEIESKMRTQSSSV